MLYKDAVRKYGKATNPDCASAWNSRSNGQFFRKKQKKSYKIEGNVFAFAAPGAASYSRNNSTS